MPLSEEIAVLDGFDGIPNEYNAGPQFDLTAGANYSGGSSWNPVMPLTPSNAGLAGADTDLEQAYSAGMRGRGRGIPDFYDAGSQFDITAGANYSGGSSWNPRMPLTPSNAGLAFVDDDLAQAYTSGMRRGGRIPNEYDAGPQFDITAGANYSGGSSWNPVMPLTPSNAGLAGTYDGHRLQDLDGLYGSTLGAIPNEYNAGPQFDITAGANYSGGSSWNPVMPLTPSNAGLAELSAIEPMDGIFDNVFKARLFRNQIPAFTRLASQAQVLKLRNAAAAAARGGNRTKAEMLGMCLRKCRAMRRNILNPKQLQQRIAKLRKWRMG
jgi:hypothetical protein